MYVEGIHFFLLSSVFTSHFNREQVRVPLQKWQQTTLWQEFVEL